MRLKVKPVTPKILTAVAIMGLVLPNFAFALLIPPATNPDDLPPDRIDPMNFIRPPSASSANRTSRALYKLRKEDSTACQIESGEKPDSTTIGQALVGAATKPMKNAINEGLGIYAVPQALTNTIQNDASAAIQADLRANINQGIKDQLKEDLPQTIAQRLQNLSEAERLEVQNNRGRFIGLIEDSIRESLPRALNEDFIKNSVGQSVDTGLRRSLQENLRLSFGNVAEPTIETYYRAQIAEMAKQIPRMVQEEVEILQSTIKGTKLGIEAIAKETFKCFVDDPICFASKALIAGITRDLNLVIGSEIDQIRILLENLVAQIQGTAEFLDWIEVFTDEDKQDEFVTEMLRLLKIQLETELTKPKNIDRLSQAITDAIADPINASIENSIDQVVDSLAEPIVAVEDAINSMDEAFLDPIADAIDLQLNAAIAAIVVPATAIVDQIGDQVALAIDNTVGAALYPLAAGITNTAAAAGGAVADGINAVGGSLLSVVMPPPEIQVVAEIGGQPLPANTPTNWGEANAFLDELGYPPLETNQMTQAMYDGTFGEGGTGLTVVPGDMAPETLAFGQMRFDDYQAALPDSAPITDAMTGVAETAAQGTEQALPAVTETAIGNHAAEFGTASPNVTNPATANIFNGLKIGFQDMFASSVGALFNGVPYVGPILSQLAQKAITAAMGSSANAGGGGGIPVVDVGAIAQQTLINVNLGSIQRDTGKIVATDKQIAEMTQKLLTLEIQSCTNLKALRRIVTTAEDNMLLWTPNAQKAKAKQAAAVTDKVVLENIMQGREVSEAVTGVDGQNYASLIPSSLPDYVAEKAKEAEMAAEDTLDEVARESSNPHLAGIIALDKAAQAKQNLLDDFRPTLSPEDIRCLQSGDPSCELSMPYLDALEAYITVGANNPIGTSLMAEDYKNQKVAEATGAAAEDWRAGGGVLSPEVCVDKTESGACRKYAKLAPGSLVNQVLSAFIGFPLDQAASAAGVGSDYIKGEFNTIIEKLWSLSGPDAAETEEAYKEAAKQSIFNKSDPCPFGACPDTGWDSVAQ